MPDSRKQIDVFINAAGVQNITGATINAAASGANGPAIFVVSSTSFESPWTRCCCRPT